MVSAVKLDHKAQRDSMVKLEHRAQRALMALMA